MALPKAGVGTLGLCLFLCLPLIGNSAVVFRKPHGKAIATLQEDEPQHLGLLGFFNATREAVEAKAVPLLASMRAQAEYEFSFSQAKDDEVKTVSKLALILLSSCLGCCGIDRCFIGSFITGVLKGISFGGLGIWAFIDQVIIIINCFEKSDKINTFGMHAKFTDSSIDQAFYAAIILLIFQVASMFQTGGSQERREETLAMMPTTLSKKLREGGVLGARPSKPELTNLFNQLDQDKNGMLDKSELRSGLASLGCPDDEIDNMISSADLDGDGQINLAEFIAALYVSES